MTSNTVKRVLPIENRQDFSCTYCWKQHHVFFTWQSDTFFGKQSRGEIMSSAKPYGDSVPEEQYKRHVPSERVHIQSHIPTSFTFPTMRFIQSIIVAAVVFMGAATAAPGVDDTIMIKRSPSSAFEPRGALDENICCSCQRDICSGFCC